MAAAVAAPALSALPSHHHSLRPSLPHHQHRRLRNPPTRATATSASSAQRVDPNANIKNLCKMGNLREAVMSISHPNTESLCSILQLCAEQRSLPEGRRLHELIISSNIQLDPVLGSKLVFMYVKCGELREGRRVFDGMLVRDNSYIWNLLMSEYAKAGEFRESIALFQKMQVSGMEPEARTFSCILKCLAAVRNVRGGEGIHGFAVKLGFDADIAVGNALISFYSKCGNIDGALDLFDGMPETDVISWNSIISGCVHNGLSRKGLDLFTEMWYSGVEIDLATLVSVIPACAELGTGFLAHGRVTHGYLIKASFMQETNPNNSLIDMYSKCGDLGDAVRVFEKMGHKSIVSWTSMISGYTRNGQFEEAIALYELMESEGIEPDLYVITSVLHACACSGSLEQGKYVHHNIVRTGIESSVFVANALMDMYAKSASMEAARSVFDCTVGKDIVSWNTLIGGYSKNSLPNEALELFSEMQFHMKPNPVTMACILPACASLSSLERGREIHGHIIRSGHLVDGHVANALVDMYAKCGALVLARLLFDRMASKDLISWTVMIAGYGMHGYGKEAISIFKYMRSKGVEPDEVSFIAILYACSHSGLLDEGWRFFNLMRNEYDIEPKLEHYACMVDLLSRAGRLSKAYKFIESMPIKPDSTIWGALLRGCRTHRDVKLAERVAEHVFKLEPENTGYYILLANIYAEAEKWEGVKKIRERIGSRGLRKNPGCSWIETKGKVHVFVAGSKSHPQSKKIDLFLEGVRKEMKDKGYVPKKRYALMNVDDTTKEEALCGHSEKLAIAFGFLNSSEGKPIRVSKNLRVCGDCHEVAKFISRMVGREIFLRDSNRFHHFEEGRCSCRGYW